MNVFFKFEEIHKVGGSAEFEVRRLKDTRTILTCRFENKDRVVVVC